MVEREKKSRILNKLAFGSRSLQTMGHEIRMRMGVKRRGGLTDVVVLMASVIVKSKNYHAGASCFQAGRIGVFSPLAGSWHL